MQMFPYSSEWLNKLSDLTNPTHSGIPCPNLGRTKRCHEFPSLSGPAVRSDGLDFLHQQWEINPFDEYLPILEGEKSAGAVCLGMLCAALPSHDLVLLQCLACGMQQNCLAPRKGELCSPSRAALERGLKPMVSAAFKSWTHLGKQSPPGDSFTVRSWFGLTFNH